jgi:hypothetical protein
MPKTTFINGDASQGTRGTRVTAEYLNAVNNHHHTGLDEDGHGALPYAVDTGTTNAYVVALSPALTQHITGMPIYFKVANANTGASTINVNGLGIKTIKKFNDQDLISGDIQAGQVVGVIYDGTNFQLISTPTKLATLNASSLVVQEPASKAQANGVASLDANSRVIQTANALWDGSAGRSASAALVINTIPVRDVNGDIGGGPGVINESITGGAATFGPAANGFITTLNVGNVTAGDRIFVSGYVNISKDATGSNGTLQVRQYTGSATIQSYNTQIAVLNGWYYPASSGGETSVCGIVRVIGSGALTLGLYIFSNSGNVTVSTPYNALHVFFLKKQ